MELSPKRLLKVLRIPSIGSGGGENILCRRVGKPCWTLPHLLSGAKNPYLLEKGQNTVSLRALAKLREAKSKTLHPHEGVRIQKRKTQTIAGRCSLPEMLNFFRRNVKQDGGALEFE